ncbi:hypothetical protein AL527_06645 [Pseudomonas fulva]|jgi:hypothetical protein|nr:hypothetical protein AL527_06645 [Pseudomonas fulva]
MKMATITVIAGGALQRVQHASRQSELGASLARSGMCEESVRDVQQHINKTKTGSANQLTRKANGCYAIDFLPLLPGHWLQRINPLTQLNT